MERLGLAAAAASCFPASIHTHAVFLQHETSIGSWQLLALNVWSKYEFWEFWFFLTVSAAVALFPALCDECRGFKLIIGEMRIIRPQNSSLRDRRVVGTAVVWTINPQ